MSYVQNAVSLPTGDNDRTYITIPQQLKYGAAVGQHAVSNPRSSSASFLAAPSSRYEATRWLGYGPSCAHLAPACAEGTPATHRRLRHEPFPTAATLASNRLHATQREVCVQTENVFFHLRNPIAPPLPPPPRATFSSWLFPARRPPPVARRPPIVCYSSIRVTPARYRLGYLLLNASAVLLVGNIPGTFLWDAEAGETADGEAFSTFLGAVALSVLAFFTVQVCITCFCTYVYATGT